MTLRIKTDVELCHKCEQLYTDTDVHITMSCLCTSMVSYYYCIMLSPLFYCQQPYNIS